MNLQQDVEETNKYVESILGHCHAKNRVSAEEFDTDKSKYDWFAHSQDGFRTGNLDNYPPGFDQNLLD